MIIINNEIIVANSNIYTQKEKAKAILFNNANFDDFQLVYIWHGQKLYKKIK